MAEVIKLAVHGAAGRMGQRIVALAQADPEIEVVAALESASHPAIGKDAGVVAGLEPMSVAIGSEVPVGVDVVIDFSIPEAAVQIAEICGQRKIPLVEATTGMSSEQLTAVRACAQQTPMVLAPSMSVAVNVAMKIVRDAARALRGMPEGVDVEIIERHHRYKEDAPSGTALRFGEIVANEMGQTMHRHGREGRTGQRPRGEIGYHALRTGDNVGEHQIVFGMLGETLEVSVRSHTRDSYAFGAIAAAKFVVTRPPGEYGMSDVLGMD